MAAITQLGLHGPQVAYGTFAAKAEAVTISLIYGVTLYAMQTRGIAAKAMQTAGVPLFAVQTARKNMRAT